MRAHPTEGPLGEAVIRTQGGQALNEFVIHTGQGTTSEGLHHDGLHADLLHLVVQVLGIGILPPARLVERGMAPIEVVHLNLGKVPVVLVLMVEQEVKHAHVTMVGEAQVADASRLALPQQELEQAVVQEAPLEGVHPAAANAMEQIIIDMVDLQVPERLLVHLAGLVQWPQALLLVGHLGRHQILVTRVPAQGLSSHRLAASALVHRGGVEVVHAVLDGIVHEHVHLVLLIGQTHHAEAQQRHLVARAVLHAIGHLALRVIALAPLRPSFLSRQHTQRIYSHRGGAQSQGAEEPASIHIRLLSHNDNC